MRAHFWCLLFCSFLGTYLEAGVNRASMDKLGFHNYNEIVRDLIKNWESPIIYLRQLGYLPSDYEDTSKIKPNLDALMSRIERDEQHEAVQTEVDKPKELDTKKLQVKKKREIVRRQQRKGGRRQRQAADTQTTNYPNMEQLMAMSQQSNPLGIAEAPATVEHNQNLQQKPVEQNAHWKMLLLSEILSHQRQARPHVDGNEDVLKRLVAKTSPYTAKLQQTAQQQVAGVLGNNGNMPQVAVMPQSSGGLLPSDNTGKSALANRMGGTAGSGDSSSISMYGTLLKSIAKPDIHSPQSSRPDQAQSEIDTKPEIEAPQYLNWDIKNMRLKQISPIAKDAYVDKLVQIFVKKQETMDILQNIQKPNL
ncbi:uncharacterized protein LOC115758061 isoform X1 [Drosophila novamexicana]|uniref:uncharacterized protein LOC115758061 isoform X1 n=1 Tax=Drosophila novamexicana TaxID=47314 RepID=UPI0011E5BD7C|nr:uncharacterized protein LOC115758061 isoform X1 [Drosophila novamexicana]